MARVKDILLNVSQEGTAAKQLNKYTIPRMEYTEAGNALTLQGKIDCLIAYFPYTDKEHWLSPRPDLKKDRALWQAILSNALQIDPVAFQILHILRVYGARAERRKNNSLHLLPGEIDAVTWDKLKAEYMEPYREGLIAVLEFCKYVGAPVEDGENKVKGLFGN